MMLKKRKTKLFLTVGYVAAAAVVAAPASALPSKSPEQLAGQTIVTGLSARTPSASLLARIRRGQVGGVVLFGRNIGSDADVAHLVSQLQAAAAAGSNPPLLVAVDQEGGAVKRLADGPPDVTLERVVEAVESFLANGPERQRAAG